MTSEIDYARAAESLEFDQPDPTFVSVYSVSRCYGGPEEGGWWYDNLVLAYYKKCETPEKAKKTERVA